MDKKIKTIAPVTCPKCSCEVLVEFTNVSPELTSVFTIEDVKSAKIEVLRRLEKISGNEAIKEEIKTWVEDPTTLFGPNEIESIIESAILDE